MNVPIFFNRLTTSAISKTPLQDENIPLMRYNQRLLNI